MHYMVTDGLTVQEQIEASSPLVAREMAKRRLAGKGQAWLGELKVFEKLDPMTENRKATEHFYGGQVIPL